NIMVGAFGEVQVMDWGLAKLLAPNAGRQADVDAPIHTPPATTFHDPRAGSGGSETQDGSMLGTPAYMAPEQAAGEIDKMDQRTDVFGLGGVLCALFTGQPPYVGQSVQAIGLAAVRGQTDEAFARLDASGAEPNVIALCKRCLAFEPGDRPADGNAVAVEVARLRAEAEERARQAEIDEARARVFAEEQTKRRRIVQVAGGFVVAILLTGLGVSLWYMDQARRAEAAALDQEQRALAHAAKEQRARETTDAVLEFVEERVLAAARPEEQEGGLGIDVKLADAIKNALPHLETSLKNQPLVAARLARTIGRSFYLLGQYDVALPLHERSVALFVAHLGRDHPDTLASMVNLAMNYAALGRKAEELALYEETVKLRKAKLGPEHPDTLLSMGNLANTYYSLGRHAEALALQEETLKSQKAKLGADDPATYLSMNNLANSYAALGRMGEALALHEETLKLRKAKLGPDHPDTLLSMGNLSVIYYHLGRQAEALALVEETLKLRKAKLGPDHPDTLHSMGNLANSYYSLGRHAEALALYEESLRLRKAKLGPDHPATLMSMNNLANSYTALGRHAEALALHEETLRLYQAKLGPDHPDTLRSMGNLANSYYHLGQHAEALALHEDTLKLRQAKFGLSDPETLLSLANLARSYRQAQRLEAALPLLEEAAQGLVKLKFIHRNAAYIMAQTTEGYEEAEQWERAEGWRRKWLAHVKEKQGPESNDYLRELAGLATNLMKQKKFAEAEPLLLENHGVLRKRSSPDPKALTQAADRLIELYTALEKPDEVKKWQAEKEKLRQQ
ncbi:MAG TPA: tetratricopeptide repeat-containing protein kinase family protein, partial [Gemmatales bacterium]|nr:tetratricopeptide repeat-containing protein kinase family protein [Gemmatales bacterium]